MIISKFHEFKHHIVDQYFAAKRAEEIPFWIVFSIAMYIPFEEFIIKWLPFSGLLRFVPEMILYGLAIKVVSQKFSSQQRLGTSTTIDILLLMFLISTLISIIINGSSFIASLENLRALWRYISVFYIVVHIDITASRLKLIMTSIKKVALLQAGLAIIQYFMPSSVNQIFAPKKFKIGDIERVSAAEAGKLKAGSVFGTFSNPAVLASFLLVALLIGISQFLTFSGEFNFKIGEISSILTLFFGIFASKKRAALLLAFVLPIVFLKYKKRFSALLKLIWIYAALIFIVILLFFFLGGNVDTSFTGNESQETTIDFTSYIAQLFSPEYYERSSENSRGWVVRITIATLIKSNSWFGFGPDLENMRGIMFDLLTDGADRTKIYALEPFEDVYWMAMLAYYGIVGMSLYGMILARLFQSAQWLTRNAKNPEYRTLGSLFCTLVILTIIYNSITRVLELRPYSFYFWLFSGLVINSYNRLRFQKS